MVRRFRSSRGFTLIELMIVISLLLILMAIAVPIYQQSILRAKESVLKQDLFTMRQVIDQYTLDKQHAPQSLEDLVSAGYMKKLPMDPFTGRVDSWVPVQDDSVEDPNQSEPGISDVHSGSNQVGSDGRPYSDW